MGSNPILSTIFKTIKRVKVSMSMKNNKDIEGIYTSRDGPHILVKVKSVTKRKNIHQMDFRLLSLEGGATFYVSNYHAFVGIRGGNKTLLQGNDIRPEDSLWIDSGAFLADGSLRRNS